MARVRVLNPRATSLELEPLALSQSLLATAHDAGDCRRLDPLSGQLVAVAPDAIEGDAGRIAFWLNLYNALLLHCLSLRPIRGSLLRHLRLFDRVAYDVGGRRYTLNVIEHGVLRRNRRPSLHLRPPLRGSDPRLDAAPAALDPRIHFALNCGARSCPPVRAYSSDGLDTELDRATGAYLEAEAAVDLQSGRVTLPHLMRLYRADFGGRAAQLAFTARYLPGLRTSLENGHERIRLRYGQFDWTVNRA